MDTTEFDLDTSALCSHWMPMIYKEAISSKLLLRQYYSTDTYVDAD